MNVRTFALLAALLLPLPMAADDITYNVDLTIGTGTVTGFIETDGVQGALGYFDVVSWNLEMTSPAGSFDIYGLSSAHQPSNSQLQELGGDSGFNLIGTPTELEFSFSGIASEVSFSPDSNFPGPDDAVNFFEEGGGASGDAGEYFVFNGVQQHTLLSGTQVIGTVGSSAVTPEPSGLLLLGTGLAGLTGMMRRKLKARSDAQL